MPAIGTVVNWHAERGFGFIAPTAGGDNLFCHATSLEGVAALQVGERVSYRVERDPKSGKLRALSVAPVSAPCLLRLFREGSGGLLEESGATTSLLRGVQRISISGVGGKTLSAPPRAGPHAPRRSFLSTAEAGSRQICLRHATGELCRAIGDECARGYHLSPPEGGREAIVKVSLAKMRLLQQKWEDVEGPGRLVQAWQLKNSRLEFLFAATKHNFGMSGRSLDMIDGWHGTPEANVLSIASAGFDASRRSGQAFGSGEYFAKDPKVSISYSKGGNFLILCKLLLGEEGTDHTWVPTMKYYVLKQNDRNVQALPLFILQFQAGSSSLSRSLEARTDEVEDSGAMRGLADRMRGGLRPEEARKEAQMTAQHTRHLWVGWLDPKLKHQSDEAIEEDVRAFLTGVQVEEVTPERNGARVGAYIRLRSFIDQAAFAALQGRLYHGQFRISVDDQQPDDPGKAGKPCPRLTGPAKACRGWNLCGHSKWHLACPFSHAENLRPTHRATFTYEDLRPGTAKHDEIETDLMRSAPFHDGQPRLLRVRRIRNETLERLYEERRAYTMQKQGHIEEKELWHGTNATAIPDLLTHGLQPPSDREASDACPRSGRKGLCTSLCDRTCRHCVAPHHWRKCHMFGLGVYFADVSKKSHRYVRSERGAGAQEVYSLLRCKVCLGRPYLIEGNLLRPDAMHDFALCDDPSDCLDTVAEDWVPTGHDAFYVRGLNASVRSGHGVYNSEYIIFHAWQVLPLYRINYTLE